MPTILTGSGGMNGNVEAGGVNNSGSIETDLFLSGVGGTAPLGASPASMWNGASGSGQYPIGAGGNAGVQPNGNGNAGGPGYVIIDNG